MPKQGILVRERILNSGQYRNHYFTFHAGGLEAKAKNEVFFPNGEVSRLLEASELKKGGKLGYAWLKAWKSGKVLFVDFFPAGRKPEAAAAKLRRKGAASVLHAAVIARMAKRYPKASIQCKLPASTDMQRHLLKMGLHYDRPYVIGEYYAKVRNYLRRTFKRRAKKS